MESVAASNLKEKVWLDHNEVSDDEDEDEDNLPWGQGLSLHKDRDDRSEDHARVDQDGERTEGQALDRHGRTEHHYSRQAATQDDQGLEN